MLYLEHTDGLRKPTGPFPAASRASLTRVTKDPTTGDDAEVPKTSPNFPSIPARPVKDGILYYRVGNKYTNDIVCTCLRGHLRQERI